jgi:hypothetical protein
MSEGVQQPRTKRSGAANSEVRDGTYAITSAILAQSAHFGNSTLSVWRTLIGILARELSLAALSMNSILGWKSEGGYLSIRTSPFYMDGAAMREAVCTKQPEIPPSNSYLGERDLQLGRSGSMNLEQQRPQSPCEIRGRYW